MQDTQIIMAMIAGLIIMMFILLTSMRDQIRRIDKNISSIERSLTILETKFQIIEWWMRKNRN